MSSETIIALTGVTSSLGIVLNASTGVVDQISATGVAATTGATGPQGEIGETGATGDTGPQGDTGIQGITGDTGPQGFIGNTGSQGESGVIVSTAEPIVTDVLWVDTDDNGGLNLALIPTGGTANQVLAKINSTDYNTQWVTGGGGAVASVNTKTGVVVLNQDEILDGTTYKQYSQTEKTKLSGIATSATANDTDANLKARANHTGTQLASTISDLSKTSVGLGSVDDTSNATERAATATLTNKTISSATNTITVTESNISDLNHLVSSNKTGYYYSTPFTSLTTRVLGSNNAQTAPIIFGNDVTATSLNIEVTVAGTTGSVIRLGIYNNNGGIPGTLVVDAGTVSGTTTGAKSITISETLAAGQYWIAIASQGAPTTHPTVRASFGFTGYIPQPLTATYVRAGFDSYGVSGALATTYSVSGQDSGEFPFVQVGI